MGGNFRWRDYYNNHSTNKQGQTIVKIVRNDGTSESKTFASKIDIRHKSSYAGW